MFGKDFLTFVIPITLCLVLGVCPKHYIDVVSSSKYCYGFVTDSKENFMHANQICKEDNAKMILVRNEKENNLIANFLSDHWIGDKEVWLGYRQVPKRKSY